MSPKLPPSAYWMREGPTRELLQNKYARTVPRGEGETCIKHLIVLLKCFFISTNLGLSLSQGCMTFLMLMKTADSDGRQRPNTRCHPALLSNLLFQKHGTPR